MKNILKDGNGITLMALITTIVLILILATVAIYSGKDILERSHLTAFTAELKIMQTYVNEIYQKYIDGETIQLGSDTYTGETILSMRKNSIDSEYSTNIEDSSLPIYNVAQNVFTSEQSGIIDKTGFLYFNKKILEDLEINDISGEFFVNIAKRSVVSCTGFEYQNKTYYTLEQLPDSVYNVEYDNLNVNRPTIQNSSIEKISEEKWRITISNIQYDGYVEKWKVKYKLETEKNWNTSDNLSFIVTKNGKYKVKVSNGSIESAEIEVGPDFSHDVSNTANAPKLSDGMIPVKWDSSKRSGKGKWVICKATDSDWYSYTATDKKWANVMLCDGRYTTSTPEGSQESINLSTLGNEGIEVSEEDLGSMFVWIPRFAYKITSGYHNVEEDGKIDVVWLNGTSYYYMDNEGNLQTAKNGNSKDEENNQITSANYYIAHPAFTDGSVNQYKYQKENYTNGEWKEEITGIWVAKFQAGFATTNNDISQKESNLNLYYPIFKGRKYAYNYVSINDSYNLCSALCDTGNIYGLKKDTNSHLMKSSEWGAVAYLSISQYGYSDGDTSKEKNINNLSLISNGSNLVESNVFNPNDNSSRIVSITGYSSTSTKALNVMTAVQVQNLTEATNINEVDNINDSSYAWNNTTLNDNKGVGTTSSTTGNIYGIYDMGGCLADYVASYIRQGNLLNGNIFANSKSSYLSTAYPIYNSNNSIYDFNNNYQSFNSVFGDAIWETSNTTISEGNSQIKGWFKQNLDTLNENTTESFWARGGSMEFSATSGLTKLDDTSGVNDYGYGFHSVLIVE